MGKQREYVEEEIIEKQKQIQVAAGDLKCVIDSLSVLIQTKLPGVNSCPTAFLQIYEKCRLSFYIFLVCKYCIWHNISTLVTSSICYTCTME